MNWAKGRATKGRGTSFKGALQYVLHDKGAKTSERVGFIEMRNLATDDPHQSWREMMTLCEAAGELKQRAGEKATGNKLKKPVYAFTLNWHEVDRPDAEHMRKTAHSALSALGMDRLQAVIVEHTDTAHRHVHVIVNLVDPETGKAAKLSNDAHKLDAWADRYEVAQGVIRSPNRRAKFAALEQGQKPPKREPQAGSRSEWEATRGKGMEAKTRAAAIRKAFANRIADMKGRQAAAQQLRRSETDRLWKGYQADRKSIRARHRQFVDAIYRPRKSASTQTMRNLQETSEWKELGRRQFRQRKAFSVRERTLLGVVSNAVRLHFAQGRKGGLASLFMLTVSFSHRREVMDERQQTERLGLRRKQTLRRKDIIRAAFNNELARSSAEFQKQREATVARHAREIAAQKDEWRSYAQDRDAAWAEFRREFNMPERSVEARGPLVRAAFNSASTGSSAERHVSEDGKARSGGEGQGDGGGVVPNTKEQGWKSRRKAAERKDDGSYRPRNRGRKNPGRTRRPTR